MVILSVMRKNKAMMDVAAFYMNINIINNVSNEINHYFVKQKIVKINE